MAVEHCGPADIGDEIQNMRDNGAAEPDLFFLARIVKPVVDEQNHEDRDADDICFSVEEESIQLHGILREFLNFGHSEL